MARLAGARRRGPEVRKRHPDIRGRPWRDQAIHMTDTETTRVNAQVGPRERMKMRRSIKQLTSHGFSQGTSTRRRRSVVLAAVGAVTLVATIATMTIASSPSGVTPTLLARGSYDSFKVMSHPEANGLFKAEAKGPIDVVVRRHDYAVGGSTGWHAHPYPVFITVISGEVTFYEYDDPTCTPTVVSAGEGYVDSGHGHLGRNLSGQPAVDISVIMAPVGAPFRAELDAPGPYCGF